MLFWDLPSIILPQDERLDGFFRRLLAMLADDLQW